MDERRSARARPKKCARKNATEDSHKSRRKAASREQRAPALARRWYAERYSSVVAVVGFASPSERRCRWLLGRGRSIRGCIVRPRLAVLASGVALACGSEPADTSDSDVLASLLLDDGGVAASELPYAPCAPEDLVGRFVIELAEDYTRVGGNVSDGVLPTRVPTELARDGECRLVEVVPSRCTPTCSAATEICDTTQTCVPLPQPRDVGSVGVAGLAVPLTMRPNGVTRAYSNPGQPALPHPGFAPGADLRLATSGGDYAPFSLRGWGVSALSLDPGPIVVAAGSPVALAWSAPELVGPARVHVSLNVNHHGSSNAWVECTFADTGSAQIPAMLVDALMAKGRSGFPTLTSTRRTATSVGIEPGCAELLVVSEVTSSIEVDGIVSCNTSMACPLGQSCLPVERFCQ